MNEHAMRELINRRPFRAFEIHLSSGERHEVRHPENVLLTKSQMVVANPETDTVVVVALLHVTSIAFVQAA